MEIRIAEEGDLLRLQALKAEVASRLFADLGCKNVQAWMNVHNSIAWWEEMISEPNRAYVVEHEGALTGTAVISPRILPDHRGVYFGSLYCRVQDAGLGSMLMRQRLVHATELEADSCYCHVLATNTKAQRLVGHYGFTPQGTFIHPQLRQPMLVFVREPHLDAETR